MASPDEILAQFQDITNESDLAKSTQILESCDYNLTIAVERYFHQNESQQSSSPAHQQQQQQQSLRRRLVPARSQSDGEDSIIDEVRIIESPNRATSAAGPSTGAAAAAASAAAQPMPLWTQYFPRWNWLQFFLGMAVGTVRKVTALGWGIFSFVSSLFVALIPSPSQHRAEGASFVRQYEERCGAAHPVFHMGTFDQAISAARLAPKLLCVFIENPDAQQATDFGRRVLQAPEVTTFLDNNFVLYGACGHSAPALFFTRQLRLRQLPAFAVMACTSNRKISVGAVLNPASPEQLVTALSELMERADPLLAEEIQRRENLREASELRAEQDAEYQRALHEHSQKRAQEQQQKKKEEEEAAAAARAESEAKSHLERREQHLLQKLNSIPEQPAEGMPSVRISFRLHDGRRSERAFNPTDATQVLYDFVESTYKIHDKFSLLTGHPKKRIEPTATSLSDAGLVGRCAIIVDLHGDEEEEEEGN